MYDHLLSLRLTATNLSALPSQAKIHRVTIINGTTNAAASAKLYDGVILTATQTQANFDGTGTNGTFTAGSGYAANDTIMLTGSTLVTVNTVSSGAVATFTVTTAGQNVKMPLTAKTQLSTSGVGTGFTLTPGNANLTTSGKNPAIEANSLEITATLWAVQTDVRFPRPYSALYGISVVMAGTGAVAYVHYTL